MRQRRWLELIKDYNLEVHYHPGKANIVAYALSLKANCNLLESLLEDEFNLMHPAVLHNITVSCSLETRIIEGQKTDVGIFHIKIKMKEVETKHFRVDEKGILWFDDRLVVPKDWELRNQILDEAYCSNLSIHPGSSKMYQDLKPYFWWTKMKKKIAAYMARCDTFCRVKTIHLKPVGLLQPLSIPGWKWEKISMDFIVGLPRTQRGNDSIWVIVDCLTKSVHFILVKSDHRPLDYAKIYVNQIVCLHGVPRTIVSDWGPQFTARFWEHLHQQLGTNLVQSSAYHPQTFGQTERVNQILEDMLRACVITAKAS
jgi:hypothetical protein